MLGFFEYMHSIIKEDYKSLEFLKAIGGLMVAITSMVLFYLSQSKKNNDFLTLNLAVSSGGKYSHITTTVTNPVNSYKYIKFACLVVSKATSLDKEINTDACKEEVDYYKFMEMLGKISRVQIDSTNDIKKLHRQKAFTSELKDFAFIPLPFFYEENIRFGNEVVSFTYPIEKNTLSSGVYDVRLFVFRKDERLHRTTQTILEI